jgi:serine/threonine protein kinase
MKSERWLKIEQLYHLALSQEPMRRDGFLAEACEGDADLRREVESLLAQTGSSGALVDHSAWAGVVSASATTQTIVKSGDTLGPYRILGLLGTGGMSEVHLAVDNRLERKIAIKVCQEQFSARFEREARAISALNHPNICTLYDVGPNSLTCKSRIHGKPSISSGEISKTKRACRKLKLSKRQGLGFQFRISVIGSSDVLS